MQTPIRILIADDHPMVRLGIATVLETQPDMLVVGQVADGAEAVSCAVETRPDIVVLDVRMPKKDGLEALQEIKTHLPEAKFLILTSFGDESLILNAIKLGAHGYLLKDSSHEEFLSAIRALAGGESALHPSAARALIQSYQAAQPATVLEKRLTPAELRVLGLIAQGYSNQHIADELVLSVRTITTHVRNILDKLGLENRIQAAVYAKEQGLA